MGDVCNFFLKKTASFSRANYPMWGIHALRLYNPDTSHVHHTAQTEKKKIKAVVSISF